MFDPVRFSTTPKPLPDFIGGVGQGGMNDIVHATWRMRRVPGSKGNLFIVFHKTIKDFPWTFSIRDNGEIWDIALHNDTVQVVLDNFKNGVVRDAQYKVVRIGTVKYVGLAVHQMAMDNGII